MTLHRALLVFGLPPAAAMPSEALVKSRYRSLAATLHPDRNLGGDPETAKRRFQELQDAYAVLSQSRTAEQERAEEEVSHQIIALEAERAQLTVPKVLLRCLRGGAPALRELFGDLSPQRTMYRSSVSSPPPQATSSDEEDKDVPGITNSDRGSRNPPGGQRTGVAGRLVASTGQWCRERYRATTRLCRRRFGVDDRLLLALLVLYVVVTALSG